MIADSKCGFYVIYYQRMRWLLIVPRFQEPQKLKKRRMKDSNLQVVSDWLVSNQLQYHYGNTAYDGILHKLPSFTCLQPTNLGKLSIPEMRFCWTVISNKTGSVIFHMYTYYCAHVRLQPITVSIFAKILGWFPRNPPDLVTVFYSAFR